MLFSVDPSAPEPLFDQLAASIRSAIIDGQLVPGTRLPAARELADALEINLHTVLRAYQALRDEGFLDLRRGRGAVVMDHVHDYERLEQLIRDVVAESTRLGLTPHAINALIREAFQ